MAPMSESLDTELALRIRRTESLTSLVRRELERMIQVGELKAGDRLNENALAMRLGVSRGPVREACRGLEQTGLVDVIVNRGVFVREIGNEEAAAVYDMRAALMRLAGRTLALRITAQQVATLRRDIERMAKAVEAHDLNTFYPINFEFHETILRFAGNERLLATCTALHREMHLFRRKTLDMPGRMAISNAEHVRIVDALEAHDVELAGREMEEHVMTSRVILFGEPG